MRADEAKKGLATPVSLLVLLSSFMILTTATYYAAMTSINTKTGRLNYAAAKQDMLTLDDQIISLTWSPGSAVVQSFQGHGEKFEVKPELRHLQINLTLGSTHDIVFNSSIGRVEYEMPSTDISEFELFLRGDGRSIINKSYTTMSQMFITNDENSKEIHLGYRPLAVSFIDRSETNLTNIIRIYVLNLNSSEDLTFQGSFRIRIHCVNVTIETRNYNLPNEVSTALAETSIDNDVDKVYLPISSNGESTIVKVEILICNIKLEEVND